jgi:hypothetical protein
MLRGTIAKIGVFGAAAGLLAVCASIPTAANAGQALTRLSAQNTAIEGKAILLPNGVDPGDAGVIPIYSNSLKVPVGNNTVYVTVSANGLGLCDGIAINCQVDGADCLTGNGAPGTGLPNGWVVPLGDEFGGDGNFGLSGMNFQFCAPITKGTHQITLNAATEFGDCNTYIEALHVYVDVNKIPDSANACTTYTNPNPVDSPD